MSYLFSATRTAAPFQFTVGQNTGQSFQGFGMGAGAKGTASSQITGTFNPLPDIDAF